MNEKVTLQDLAAMVADDCKISRKKADLFIRDMFDVILEALKKEKYAKIKGLGTFKLTEVSPRVSINVSTGERFEIQGHRKITFTPENKLKELINKPFAHFDPVILNEGVQFDDVPDDIEIESETEAEVPVVVEENPVVADSIAEIPKNEVIVEPELPSEVEPIEESESHPVQEKPVEEEQVPEESNEIQEEEPVIEPVVEDLKEIEEEEPTPETIKEEPVAESEITPIPPKEEDSSVIPPEPVPLMDVKKKKVPWGWILGILCALLLICLLLWLLIPKKVKDEPYEVYQPEQTVVPAVADTLKQETPVEEKQPQTESVKEQVSTSNPVNTTQPSAPVAVPNTTPLKTNVVKETVADTLEYRITGLKTTYTLKEGETLARVAANFYQNRRLWPYIAKYNKEILPNENRVVPGMVIRIPELTPIK